MKETELKTKYYGTKAAARYLGLSHKTLEKYRVSGGGPRFIKIGRQAKYLLEDLDEWATRSAFVSTSQYAKLPNYRGL